MKALTWWHFWPAILVLFVIPFFPMVVPNFDANGHVMGGGIIRDYVVNIFLPIFSYDSKLMIADTYYSSKGLELSIYAFFALQFSLLFSWVGFLVVETYMKIHNWFGRKSMKAEQTSLRR